MIGLRKLFNRRLINNLFFLLFFLLPGICLSQTQDTSDEIVLGLNYRSSILESYPEGRGTKEDIVAQNVFRRLITTSVSQDAPPMPYKVTVIDTQMINAFATPGGQVYVAEGMAQLLGEEEGLWAAVLGHEIGHNMGRWGGPKMWDTSVA